MPVSALTRPRIASVSALGCSMISLSMKCLYPPFSIAESDISSLTSAFGRE